MRKDLQVHRTIISTPIFTRSNYSSTSKVVADDTESPQYRATGATIGRSDIESPTDSWNPSHSLKTHQSSQSPQARLMQPPIRRRIHNDTSKEIESEFSYLPASASNDESQVPREFHMFEMMTTSPVAMGMGMDMTSLRQLARRSMDGSDISCSSIGNLTMATSATSSVITDPWGCEGYVEEDEDAMGNDEEKDEGQYNWDDIQCKREIGNEDRSRAGREGEGEVVPKLEPLDDVDMMNLSPAASEELKSSASPAGQETALLVAEHEPGMAMTKIKRPRGRPRKHPKPTPESLANVAKGRSKTGCITCRKRKKKCDETKPGCMNCEKNSVKCEGYPEKTIWKSGKERAEEVRMRRASIITLSSIRLPYLVHGIETEGDLIFLDHYITRLSIIFTVEGERDSAFRNILLPMAQQHSGLMHSILALSGKHINYESAYGAKILQDHPKVDIDSLQKRSQFHEDEALKELIKIQENAKATAATYAQMICLILQTLSDPHPNGQHRFHLQHYQRLIKESPPEDGETMCFIHEFFQYHIQVDQLIALPDTDSDADDQSPPLSMTHEWNLPSTVLQHSTVRLLGVFDGLFLYMSKITNIRNKIRRNIKAGLDPIVDYKALHAAAEIDAGIREWSPVWSPGDPREMAGMLYRQMMWIYLWRTIYPPQTTNWNFDRHITAAVRDAVKLLESFGQKDSNQTLLLAPAFVVGCACFEVEMREPIRKAIGRVKEYMEYKNTDTALEVLEEVWRLMNQKAEESWDWQSIAKRMGLDFLAT